eukprot:gene12056-15160_t
MATADELTCCSTINACALLSLDALCCIPCCMCCGGCCGKYDTCVASAFDDLKSKPGQESGVIKLAKNNSAAPVTPTNDAVITPPPKQTFERELNDFATDFLNDK